MKQVKYKDKLYTYIVSKLLIMIVIRTIKYFHLDIFQVFKVYEQISQILYINKYSIEIRKQEMNFQQIFQLKINENKLQNILQNILKTQQKQQQQLTKLSSELIQSNKHNQYLVQSIQTTFLKNIKTIEEDIYKIRCQSQQDIYQMKKNRMKDIKQIQQLTERVVNAEDKVEGMTDNYSHLDGISQINQQIATIAGRIVQCQKSIMQLCLQQRQLYNNVLESTIEKFQKQNNHKNTNTTNNKNSVLKKTTKHNKKYQYEQSKSRQSLVINIKQVQKLQQQYTPKQQNKHQRYSANNFAIKQQSVISQQGQLENFKEYFDENRKNTKKLREDFRKYIRQGNFKGAKQNQHLSYAVISGKIADLEIEIKNIKQKQQNSDNFCQSVASQSQFKEKTAQKKTRTIHNLQRSNSEMLEGHNSEDNKIVIIEKDMENLRVNLQSKIQKLFEQLTQLKDKKLSVIQSKLQKVQKKVNQKSLSNQKQQQIPYSQLYYKLSSNLQQKLEQKNIITKANLPKYLASIQNKITKLTELINNKSNKKQMKEAFFFIEDKIREIVVVMASIQQKKMQIAVSNNGNQCLSCEKEGEGAYIDSNRQSHIRTTKSSRITTRNKLGEDKNRIFRKSDGLA